MHRNSPRWGLTLVELLAALVLCGLLLVCLMGLTVDLFRTHSEILALGEAHGWRRDVATQLRWDIEHAQKIRVQGEQLTLSGTGALDARLEPLHHPVTVWYYTQHDGQRWWLIREQRVQNSRSTGSPQVELLAAGIQRLELKLPEQRSQRPTTVNPHLRLLTASQLAPLPLEFHLRMFDEQGAMVIDEYFWRGEGP